MRLVVMLVCSLPLLSCVEPPEQPDALPYWMLNKAHFADGGEWYFQRTVTEVPYTAGFTFVGDADLVDRIQWKIEEGFLIAYRAHPLIGGNEHDVAGGNDYDAPVAMYPIRRHFDVEGDSVIERPMRPWYERGWMDVDWGNDLVTSHRFSVARLERGGPSYVVTDPSDPEAIRFGVRSGGGWQDSMGGELPRMPRIDHIEFTTHVTVSPTLQADPETGNPGCNGGIADSIIDIYDCAPSDIAFRTSILRRLPDNDFEQKKRPTGLLAKRWFARFFQMGTYFLDDEYGLTDAGLDLKVSHFGIWQRSTDDDGAPLPYRERKVRPIAFHVNGNFDPALLGVARDALESWDEAFVETVRDLRLSECVDAGGSAADCAGDVEVPEDVLVFCPHNPVQKDDPEACGIAGTVARVGDLRYNMLAWITTPNVNRIVGLAWWAPDLQTGEIVNASAKLYAPDIDRAAATTRDAILLMRGDITPEDLFRGGYVPSSMADLEELVHSLERYSEDPFAANIEVSERTRPFGGPDGSPVPGQSLGTPDTFDGASFRSSSLAPFVGTRFESSAVDVESLLLAGIDPRSDDLSAEMIGAASPLRRSFASRPRRLTETKLRELGGDLDLPVAADLAYLLDETSELSADELYQEVRRRFAQATMMHELGHAFGLTHNFSGSYDAFNYKQGYWDARDPTPRYDRQPSPGERDGNLTDYAYASVMDYHPSANAYLHGIGSFDKAAIKWLYGDLVEVFDPGDGDLELLKAMWFRQPEPHLPTVIVDDPSHPGGHTHRSLHPAKLAQEYPNLLQRDWVPLAKLEDPYDWGAPLAAADGRVAVPYLSCNDELIGVLPYCQPYDMGLDPYEIVSNLSNWYHAYYMLNSFRRARLDFSTTRYVDQMWMRVFFPLKKWQNWLAHSQWEFAMQEPTVHSDEDFLEPLARSADVSFNFLARLLAVPNFGPHRQVTMPTGEELLVTHEFNLAISHPDPPMDAPTMTLPLGPGRIYTSLFSITTSRFDVENIGTAVDKELALEALLDPSFFWFPGRETWSDVELWMVNFYWTHAPELLDVMGSVIVADTTRLAAYWDGDEASYRDFTDLSSTSAGVAIDPAIGFSLRLRAAIYGIGLLYSGYVDKSFLDYSRIYVVGADDEVPLDPSVPVVDFLDPRTGKLYRAPSFLTVEGIELGIGARLLQKAQGSLLASTGAASPEYAAWAADMLKDDLAVIELLRGLVQRFEDATFTGPINSLDRLP